MENLRIIREKRHKNQLNVALAVGVTQESISMYESGVSYPSAIVLIKLAKYLETSTDYLLGLTDDKNRVNLNKQNIDNIDIAFYNQHGIVTEEQMKEVSKFIDFIKNRDEK